MEFKVLVHCFWLTPPLSCGAPVPRAYIPQLPSQSVPMSAWFLTSLCLSYLLLLSCVYSAVLGLVSAST